MRSSVVESTFAGQSRLECSSDAEGPPQCTLLEQPPVLIGRSEDANLQINSGRVSRQHAVIECEGGRWSVRDLNSTNGTFVNGQRLSSANLQDGDVITIAETSLTFRTDDGDAEDSDEQRAAQTLCMPAESQAAPPMTTGDWIGKVRRYQEAVLHGGYIVNLTAVVPIDGNQVFGHQAGVVAGTVQRKHELSGGLFSTPCRLTRRYLASSRVVAIQKAVEANIRGRLFLRIDPCEASDWASLRSQVEWLQQQIPPDLVPVLAIPSSAVVDAAFVASVRDLSNDLGIEICYSEFNGGRAEVRRFQDSAPDYVILAGDVVGGGQPGEHNRRQITQLVEAFQAAGCVPIVRALWNERNRTLLRELGFQYVLKQRVTPP